MIKVDSVWYMSCDHTLKGRDCQAEIEDFGDDSDATDYADANGWTIVTPNNEHRSEGKTYCPDHKPA